MLQFQTPGVLGNVFLSQLLDIALFVQIRWSGLERLRFDQAFGLAAQKNTAVFYVAARILFLSLNLKDKSINVTQAVIGWRLS